jgi:LCP family protein required for cell wall assembly
MSEYRKDYNMATDKRAKHTKGRQVRTEDPKQAKRLSKKRRQAKRRKRLIAILAVELVLILILGIGVWGLNKLDKIQDLGVDAEDIEINEMDEATQEVLKGYTNIALFGIDTRTIGELGAGNRSDTIIIASINNETKEVKLVSVYRDTYLNRADDTYGKCNAAYKSGGPKQAIAMLNMNLDLNIKYYVSIDFVALIKTIDLLGGIDIDIQENEWELVNNYMYETTYITQDYLDHNSVFLEGPGLQTLDGLQATSYCRIRKTAGSDYRRTERQREVISLIAAKAKKASLSTINNIIDEVFPLIATNIPKTEMLGMATSLMSYEIGETSGFPTLLEEVTLNKADTVAPADLETNVTELHKFLFDEEDYYPSPTVIKLSQKISADTGVYASESE